MKPNLLFCILLACAGGVQAQVSVENTGVLYVTGTETLYINGGFTNRSTAALTNNGSFYIRQNVSNAQASMAVGTGTLYLNGAASQTLSGTQPFYTYNLVTNNGAGIVLNNNLRVSGSHTFTSGIISTSATNYLVYEAGSSYSGDADARHVNGWVKKIGSTSFAYPVGNGTYERKISVANLSAASEFNVRHRTTTPNYNIVQYPLLQADRYEYWEVNRVSGGTAVLGINWDNSKISFPDWVLPEIRVSYYNGSVWSDQGGSASGSVYTTGSITSNTISTFGIFSTASVGWTLPLKFISVSAQRDKNNVQVAWTTAQENNVDHFEIERSSATSDFRQVGTVDAINNGNGATYTYTDRMALAGTAWYRIKGLDKDGKSTYSAIAVVGQDNAASYLKVLNNPATDAIMVSASAGYSGAYGYELYNHAGQLVQKGNINLAAYNINRITLGNKVIPGVYVLQLRNDEHQLTEKIIVK